MDDVSSVEINTEVNSNPVTTTDVNNKNDEGEMANGNKIEDPNSTSESLPVPEIGSKNSAFLPYKPLTILTNLQRGNVKTLNKDVPTESLTFHERAAKGELTVEEITRTNVNSVDDNGTSAIMWAAYHGRTSIVQVLLDHKAEVDFRGKEGETALMYASSNGHVDVVRLLLSNGAEVEATDDEGNTALMFAANGNHPQVVHELLTKGAHMTRQNGMGDTPYELVVAKGLSAAQTVMENYLRMRVGTLLLKK